MIPKENLEGLENDLSNDLKKLDAGKYLRQGDAVAKMADDMKDNDSGEYSSVQKAMYKVAIDSYKIALAINPECKEAIDGKKRVEEYLKI